MSDVSIESIATAGAVLAFLLRRLLASRADAAFS